MLNNRFVAKLKSSALGDIISWAKGIKFSVLLIALGNMSITALALYMALESRTIVDAAINGNKPQMVKTAVILSVIIALQICIWFFTSRARVVTKARFINNMRERTLNEILKKQYSSVAAYHSGELVNRMFSDINIIADGVLGIIPPVLAMATQLIGAFIILARIDIKFVLVIVVAALLAFITTLFFRKKSKALHKDVQEKEGKVHATLQESLQNIRLIKASESEERIFENANKKQDEFLSSQKKRANFVSFANSGLHFVFRGGWLYAMLWGAFGILTKKITYGTLTAILQLVGQIQSPFANMTGLVSTFYSTLASAERIKELYDLPEEEKTETALTDKTSLYKSIDEICFNNVTFNYGKGAEDVLKNASFTVKPGDFTAVTGLSGGGKSTMFLLTLGIYTPNSGSVCFKTENGEIKAGANTRKLFSYVPQGNALFSGTLRENIGMFCENATNSQIMDAAKTACIDQFIAELPQGLDTVIGERGLGLSEGQAQRIAVARAVLSNAPILLLDEATSALDEKTEAQLLKNIASLKNKGCFIVTHRRAALSICNKQIILEDGNVTLKDIQ